MEGTRSCTRWRSSSSKGRGCRAAHRRAPASDGVAAWAGLLVTMINLLPIGQLDGGHIATAYFGNRYNRVRGSAAPLAAGRGARWCSSWVLHVGQAGDRAPPGGSGPARSIAMAAAAPWLVWFLLVGLMRRMTGGVNHPAGRRQPLPPSRRALFWLMVVVFVAVFMPVPFRDSDVPRVSHEGPRVRDAARGDPRQPGEAAPAAEHRGAARAQPVQRRGHHPRRAFVPGAGDRAGRQRALLRARRDGDGSLREHRRASPTRPR